MEFMIRVEIPALDRLCDLMENRTPWLTKSKEALQHKLQEAVQQVAAQILPEPEAETLARAAEAPKEEPAPATEAVQAAQEPSETPEPKPTANPEPPKGAAVTLDAVQRASAELRDQGKLKAVTDMFPEFGIKKLSDLSGDKLQAFAERLRKMGATL